MNILVTNDDGWGSPGIKTLESVARELGTVWTVAPALPMSGISHQMTFEVKMMFEQKAERSFALSGTPADCARVGLTLLDVEFDWILSGINKGANLGADVNVSGTVAAVREASLFEVPGVALSQHFRNMNNSFDWNTPARLASRLLPKLMKQSVHRRTWFNVNFPDLSGEDIENTEFVETELDLNPLPYSYEVLSSGEIIYNGQYKDRVRTSGHDADVCFSKNVSITRH